MPGDLFGRPPNVQNVQSPEQAMMFKLLSPWVTRMAQGAMMNMPQNPQMWNPSMANPRQITNPWWSMMNRGGKGMGPQGPQNPTRGGQ